VIEEAGKRALSDEVRSSVLNAAQYWNGSDQGIDNKWYDKAMAPLTVMDIAAGRLALLTAFAPYRVDETIIGAFSTRYPGDDLLIAALAWSSFTAARRIGTWLQ
jgi:hypothetical protein